MIFNLRELCNQKNWDDTNQQVESDQMVEKLIENIHEE